MSFAELLEKLDDLSPQQLAQIREKADSLMHVEEFRETPELLATLDEAEAEAERGPNISLAEAEREMREWLRSR